MAQNEQSKLFCRFGLVFFAIFLVWSVWTVLQWANAGVSVQHIKGSGNFPILASINPLQYYINFIPYLAGIIFCLLAVLWFSYTIFVLEPLEAKGGSQAVLAHEPPQPIKLLKDVFIALLHNSIGVSG